MTFPIVASSATTLAADPAFGGNATLNLPSGIASGDLLVMFKEHYNGLTGIPVLVPSGWTSIQLNHFGDSQQATLIAHKVAAGTEGSSIAWPSSSGGAIATICLRVTGAALLEAATASPGSTASPDAPNLSPSWAVSDTLWLACLGWRGNGDELTGDPTSYGSAINVSGGFDSVSARILTRNLNATSNDPSAWSFSTARFASAATVAIAAAPPVPGVWAVR